MCLRSGYYELTCWLDFQLKKAIEQNGGTYRRDLQNKDTTHVICSEAKGDKFDYAMRWKVPVVTAEWIEESVKAGMNHADLHLTFQKHVIIFLL